MASGVAQLGIRIEQSVLERIDEEVRRMNHGRVGPQCTRVDVVRLALAEYFVRRDHGSDPPKS